MKDAEILVSDNNLITQVMYSLPKIKWVQSTWAGVENIMIAVAKSGRKPDYTFTRFSGAAFGRAISDYVIANIINWERNFYTCFSNKNNKMW